VEYREYLVGRHGDFDPDVIHEQLAWLAAHPRERFPTHFHFETRSVRHGRTHLVTIEQMAEVLKPATLDVTVESDQLVVRTANVRALTVSLGDETASGRIKLDDTELPLPVSGDIPVVTFEKRDGRWRKVANWPPDDSLRKTRGVEGPVQDVMRDPFTVVVGTGGGEDWCEAAEAEAARFEAEWFRRYGAEPPRVCDTRVTDDLLARRNVVFFGRAADDSPMRAILDRMPVRVADDAVEIDGRRFTGDDVGTIFCYPTPERRGRMVAVLTALTPDAFYQVSTRFGNWFNWGVHDHRKWFDYCVYDAKTANPETYPLVGFFGTDWSFERGRRWTPTPEALARAAAQGVPQATPAEGDTLYLSALIPAKIDQMRGAVGFDRSFRGNRIVVGGRDYDRGLGVRCPSRITYDLDGRCTRLTAVVGFTSDPEEGFSTPRLELEKVTFVVSGDGKRLHAEPIDWETPSAAVAVDVTGVKRLTLSVKAAGGALWLHGSTAWADVKLTR